MDRNSPAGISLQSTVWLVLGLVTLCSACWITVLMWESAISAHRYPRHVSLAAGYFSTICIWITAMCQLCWSAILRRRLKAFREL